MMQDPAISYSNSPPQDPRDLARGVKSSKRQISEAERDMPDKAIWQAERVPAWDRMTKRGIFLHEAPSFFSLLLWVPSGFTTFR